MTATRPLDKLRHARRQARPLRWTQVLTAGALGLLCGFTHALSSDSEQPIHIEADRAEADESKRVTIYRGDAVITQGSLRITGETVWLYFNENDEFIKLVSIGSPAHLRQLPDGAKDYRTADARRLEYYAQKNLILLLGNAVYGQGRDKIRADRIEYDSLRGKMLARTAPFRSKTGNDKKRPKTRVKIQISPKKKSN